MILNQKRDDFALVLHDFALVLHDFALVLHDFALFCMILHDFAWFCMILHFSMSQTIKYFIRISNIHFYIFGHFHECMDKNRHMKQCAIVEGDLRLPKFRHRRKLDYNL